MLNQENYAEKAANVWAGQMERWLESVGTYQAHMQKLMESWMEQTVELQKEGQKVMTDWVDSVAKSQNELWRTLGAGGRETAESARQRDS
jgi:Na+/phosphate symporter